MNKIYVIIPCLLGLASSLSAQTLNVCTDQKGRCGYADTQGNVVVECKYDAAFPFRDGVGKVGKGEKLGLVDASGKEILAPKYDEIELWSEGVYRFKAGSKYGLVSAEGGVLAKCEYSFISLPNCHGKAWIAKGGSEKKGALSGAKMGLVDATGKILIAPEYTKLCEFSPVNGRPETGGNSILLSDTLKSDCRYVSCFDGKKNIVMDGQGNAVTPLTDKAVYLAPTSGMCAFSIQNGSKTTSGYWDIAAKSNILLSNKEQRIKALVCTPFTGNVAKIDNPVTRASYFIDKSGKKISDYYTKAKHKNGYWIVLGTDKRCALLGDEGKFVFEAGRFEDIKFPDAGSGLFPVKQDGKWGLADAQGNMLLPAEYENLESPRAGRLLATKGGRQGIIGTDGTVVVPFEFRYIQPGEADAAHVWVCKDDSLLYDFDIARGRTVGGEMRVAADFHDGLAWAVPQGQQLQGSVSIIKSLCELYGIKVKSQVPVSFGILVDEEGRQRTHIPVPQEMFPMMARELAGNGGSLTPAAEKRLLLTHTRAVRVYKLSESIPEEDWDY